MQFSKKSAFNIAENSISNFIKKNNIPLASSDIQVAKTTREISITHAIEAARNVVSLENKAELKLSFKRI